MSINLKQYDNIIIDYSAMFVSLEPDLVEQLENNDKVVFSPTFECDCRHFLRSVPSRVKTLYESNKNSISFSNDKVCNTWGVVDTYALAKWFSLNHGSTVVIAANLSLEDRIIFSGINVDIYSWDEERIIGHQAFVDEQKNRKIDKSKTPLPFYEVKAGNNVYSDMGTYILDGDPNDVGSGAEAGIYKIKGNSNLLAKIYKLDEADDKNTLTKQKHQNIINLQELGDGWGIDWVALPQAVLYADLARTKPVGYIMKRITGTFMSNMTLFSNGDIREKLSENETITVRDVLETCLQFVSQFMFLSANGMNLADYNDRNFALTQAGLTRKFKMVDTDSYCYDEYVCDYPTFANSLSRKYEFNNRLGVINICEESLLVYIFTLLTLDPDCKPIRKNEFRFSKDKLDNYIVKEQFINLARWNSIPQNLQKVYIDVFEKKHNASVSVLLYELDQATKLSFANKKYTELYKNVVPPSSSKPTTQKSSTNTTTTSNTTQTTTSGSQRKSTTSTNQSASGAGAGSGYPKAARFFAWLILIIIAAFVIAAITGYFDAVSNGETIFNIETFFRHLWNVLTS